MLFMAGQEREFEELNHKDKAFKDNTYYDL